VVAACGAGGRRFDPRRVLPVLRRHEVAPNLAPRDGGVELAGMRFVLVMERGDEDLAGTRTARPLGGGGSSPP
jgi:hypothetical protein